MKKQFMRFLCALLAVLTVMGASLFSPVSADGGDSAAETLTISGNIGNSLYILWWMKGCPEPENGDNRFSDVADDDYRLPAMIWAVESGIINPIVQARPDGARPRGSMAVILHRAMGSPEPKGTEMPYVDVDPYAYYYKAVLWCVESDSVDLMTSGDRFYPDNEVVSIYATRSEDGVTFSFADPAHEHDFIDEASKPLCAENVSVVHFCRVCCYSYVEKLTERADHVWSEWKTRVKPSPEHEGNEYRYCVNCGLNQYRAIPALGTRFTYEVADGRAVITGYDGDTTDLSIPSEIDGYPVSAIGNFAFASDNSIKTLTVSDGVTAIGDYAFLGCKSLEKLTLPDSLSTIGNNAFEACSGLTGEMTVPPGVVNIGQYAFSGCANITSVFIPARTKNVGLAAFGSIPSLEKVTVDKNNTAYASVDGVLYDKKLTTIICCPCQKRSVSLPIYLKKIAYGAFGGCTNLSEITLPKGVTSIGESAFSDCSSLTSVTVPDGVSDLVADVFAGCTSLESVYLPAGLTHVDPVAFLFCRSLSDVFYRGTVSEWKNLRIIFPDTVTVHCAAERAAAPSFSDVANNAYYADPVVWAVSNGVTQGAGGGKFSPGAGCKRSQVVTFLWRAAGSPAPKMSKNPFSDVKSSDYFFSAVLWAVENGVTAGTSKTAFSPDATCTRAQIVTFLWRAAGSPAPKSGRIPFSDVKGSDYFARAVLWAAENGVTAGTSKTAFSPESVCTRAQIVTFLYRSVK